MKISFLFLAIVTASDAFVAPTNICKASLKPIDSTFRTRIFSSENDQENFPIPEVPAEGSKSFNPLPAATVALCLLSSTAASAAGPDWGKFCVEFCYLFFEIYMKCQNAT
jgi:hypothetical protein